MAQLLRSIVAKHGWPIVFAAAVLAVAAVVGTSLLRRGAAPEAPAFGERQRVAPSSNLHFSFPARMDHASVVESMTLPEGVQGAWAWEDEVLVFDPAENLAAGKTYAFRLSAKAEKATGEPLAREIEFVFTVAGAPEVTVRMPSPDARGVEPGARITLLFDRPVIPLTQVQGEAAERRLEGWPVTITPAVAGRWRWLSTVAVEFLPEEGFVPAMLYTVSVPPGIETVAGDRTEADFSWSFETVRPEVIATTPPAWSALAGPKTEVTLTFNQEMDLASARDAISLAAVREEARESLVLKPLRFAEKEAEGKMIPDRSTVVIAPKEPLVFETGYEVTVAPGLRAARGELGTASGFTLSFRTAGPLSVVKSGLEWGSLVIGFNNPVASGSLQGAITISPEVPGWGEIVWTPSEWTEDREVTVYPSLKPSTTYTVTVGTGVADIFGQRLAEPYSFTFTTAPIPSEVRIHSKGSFGVFERGKPPVTLLQAVNVSRVDVEVARLSLEKFLSLRNAYYVAYEEAPETLQDFEGFRRFTLTPKAEKDAWQTIPFDVGEMMGASLRPGIYLLTAKAPEYRNEWDKEQIVVPQFFALTNIALTVKHSGDRVLVWAVDMQTGEPVPGAAIALHSLNGTTPVTGATDAEGFFETVINVRDFVSLQNEWEPEFWVTAEKDGDFAFAGSTWRDGMEPWNFDMTSDFRGPQAGEFIADAFLSTERPLYRAGDTVFFKGIVRLRDRGGTYQLPGPDRSVRVTVQDPNFNEVFKKELSFTEFGSFAGEFPIGSGAALGDYSLSAQVLPDANLAYQYLSTSFSVLAYRKPEYRVEVTPAQEDSYGGDTVETLIEGSYYFGAPMAGAPVSWRALTADYFFNRFTDGWYSFALEDAWCFWDCERESSLLADGQGALDAEGKLHVRIPADLSAKGVSQILTIEADVTDPNNQVVSNRASVPVHKAALYVGVRTEDYIVRPGEEARIGVVTVQPDGSPLPNQRVRLQLFSRTWNTIRKKGVDGDYYDESEPTDTCLREFTVRTGDGGKATAQIPIESGGGFGVVATVQDSEGREAKAGAGVYAWSDTFINWPRANNNRIEVLADKPEYQIGDTAKLLVKSPYQGAGVKALVTVERERVMQRQVIDITSNAQAIEIPITQDFVPNAYVSVVVIKPRVGETFDENGLDTGAPAFRIGYAKLSVDTSSRRLTVEILPGKEQYLPGEEAAVKLRVTDASGKPVRAELSLGAVDMSVLALSAFEAPDLVERFYGERGLGVYTAETPLHLIKGGGGGALSEKKRGEFRDPAYWNPAILTDEKGEATVTFRLPDNLTTWHLLALGHTKEHTFGTAWKTLVATKQVILRPVRPRFAVAGDEAELGAIVHNFLPQEASFTVSLTGSGFDALGDASQEVSLAPGAMQKLVFPVRMARGERALFTFKAEGGGARDEIEESIPVYSFGTPQSVATTGIVEGSALEQVLVPTEEDAPEGLLRAIVSPSLATYLPGGLEYLLKFPYGCTEQTISAFLPSVALRKLQGFEAFEIVRDRALDRKVLAGLQKIYAAQRGDGGLGFFDGSRTSNPYLSAYGLYALHLARSAGFEIDEGVASRLREFLQGVLRRQDLQQRLDLATRAYILFVLAEEGTQDMSLLQNLYEKREDLPLFARAYLMMALVKGELQTPAKIQTLLQEIQDRAKVDGRGVHFEEEDTGYYNALMHTNVRTTAIVLQALLRAMPDHPFIPEITRHLLSVRKDGHWDTTQSTTQTLLAFVDYLRETGELQGDFRATVTVSGNPVLTEHFAQENIRTRRDVEIALDGLLRGQENEVIFAKEGAGRLYYDLLLSYFYAGDTLPPAEEGISILREMEPLPGQEEEEVTVGNTYRVTLTITVPQDRYFVAVSSPLPAGMEPIDLSLATAQRGLLRGEEDEEVPWWSEEYWESGLWNFNHQEYRDDEVFYFADELPAGVYQLHYLVRATTPGRFRERPARVWQMYFPEVFGQTAGGWFTVRP